MPETTGRMGSEWYPATGPDTSLAGCFQRLLLSYNINIVNQLGGQSEHRSNRESWIRSPGVPIGRGFIDSAGGQPESTCWL